MTSGDTIVAISSAVGTAARMIVRLNGPSALPLVSAITSDAVPEHAAAFRTHLSFSSLRVPAWAYLFRNPHSYTGEDAVEFHLPGNPLLADLLLRELIARGARLAEPGEFTARAYFNGRIDLTEAEGVAATIAAGNEAELRAARRLLAGELARRLAPAMDLVAETLALVEAGIDFVDEEGVSFLSPDELRDRIGRADGALAGLLADSARFERLVHEPQVVLAGRPNAGKSTLLNALAGHERAVTSPAAGTTRDVLSAEVSLPRGLVKLTDVAGLEERDAPDGSGDDIDRQMRRHALRAVESADVLVLVREAADSRPPLPLPREPDLVVRSKADLLTRAGSGHTANTPVGWHGQPCSPVASPREPDHGQTSLPMPPSIFVSALAGENLARLRDRLDRLAFGDAAAASASALALNARHVRAVAEARAALARAVERVGEGASELLALELRDALDALGGVLGQVTPDDLLGRIFSTFCIGK